MNNVQHFLKMTRHNIDKLDLVLSGFLQQTDKQSASEQENIQKFQQMNFHLVLNVL